MRPYQELWTRQPFRAPQDDSLVDNVRGRILYAAYGVALRFDRPASFVAEWAGYIGYNVSGLDLILAGAIDIGDEEVYRTLIQTIRGEHPTAAISTNAIRALLACSRPDAWREIERLLLAAQRQEGLRQTILESADETHPKVFPFFLRTIAEHDLLRFSSVYRAFLTWIPGLPEETKPKTGPQILGRIADFVSNPRLDPNPSEQMDVYVRLWADAFDDVRAAIARADNLSASPVAEVRLAVARLLGQLGITHTLPLLKRLLGDADLRVVSAALNGLGRFSREQLEPGDFAAVIWALADRWPSKASEGVVKREDVWDRLYDAIQLAKLSDLAPFVHEFSVGGRSNFAAHLSEIKDVRLRRDLALRLSGDASPNVRSWALKQLRTTPINESEAPLIEDLLRRKAADIRHAAMSLLQSQATSPLLASAQRLMSTAAAEQRAAGLELLALTFERGTEQSKIRVIVGEFSRSDRKLSEAESGLVERILRSGAKPDDDLDSGLGLYDPTKLYFAPKPAATGVSYISTAAVRCLESLDELLDRNRNLEVPLRGWFGAEFEPVLVGDLVGKHWRPNRSVTYEQDRDRFPVADLVEAWITDRGLDLRDTDGLELVRAHLITLEVGSKSHLPPRELKNWKLVEMCMPWVIRYETGRLTVGSLLDMLSEVIANRASDSFDGEGVDLANDSKASWRLNHAIVDTVNIAVDVISRAPVGPDDVRLYQMLRFIDEPCGPAVRPRLYQRRARHVGPHERFTDSIPENTDKKLPRRLPIRLSVLERALEVGACTEAEVIDQLAFSTEFGHTRYHGLTHLQRLGRVADEGRLVLVRAAAEKLVSRVVEIESRRGDLPTPVTGLAVLVDVGVHLDQVCPLLRANVPLSRSSAVSASRESVFQHLFSVSRPGPGETPERCAEAFQACGAKEPRLLELAMHSPQWAAGVELAIDWPGFADGIWWMHAHTKDDHWSVDPGIKEIWQGEISERTPLAPDRLLEGATDAVWYRRFRPKLTDKQWQAIDKVAKFAAGGSGHVRVQLCAKAMDGTVSVADLEARIKEKRHVDAVRALGLVPLGPHRESEIRSRYMTFQEFLRGSRKFGSMRQTTEKMAVTIALENLAWTAGFPDPLRLTWAIEAREAGDLRGSGLSVSAADVTVRLFFDGLGEPVVEAVKGDKLLAEVPSAAKKDPAVKELITRRTNLRKQAQRMRMALEQAMQRGDKFEPDELAGLLDHPGLAPLLRNLVFLDESGAVGFLSASGRLEGGSGKLWIAHPHDLLKRGDWPEWQHVIFGQERVQPFKQVFRELYVLTDREKESTESTRYAGHQLQPRQALAILGKRGWVVRQEEGISKTLHELRLTARIVFEEYFFSPADVEGLTLKSLYFTKSGEWKPIPLNEIPTKAFSETMRDLDLIVSVASMVGVDPDASESTVEMRASVVREMALLLGLGNISITGRSVVVGGQLGEYSVHLGSAVVHQRTRGALEIRPVRQPQRGRLFLPFVDDDPRTAEVVSKVLLLAKDNEIKDPSILSQIVRIDG